MERDVIGTVAYVEPRHLNDIYLSSVSMDYSRQSYTKARQWVITFRGITFHSLACFSLSV